MSRALCARLRGLDGEYQRAAGRVLVVPLEEAAGAFSAAGGARGGAAAGGAGDSGVSAQDGVAPGFDISEWGWDFLGGMNTRKTLDEKIVDADEKIVDAKMEVEKSAAELSKLLNALPRRDAVTWAEEVDGWLVTIERETRTWLGLVRRSARERVGAVLLPGESP